MDVINLSLVFVDVAILFMFRHVPPSSKNPEKNVFFVVVTLRKPLGQVEDDGYCPKLDIVGRVGTVVTDAP